MKGTWHKSASENSHFVHLIGLSKIMQLVNVIIITTVVSGEQFCDALI